MGKRRSRRRHWYTDDYFSGNHVMLPGLVSKPKAKVKIHVSHFPDIKQAYEDIFTTDNPYYCIGTDGPLY